MDNPFWLSTYIYTPKEYWAKVIWQDSSRRYLVQDLESNKLAFYIFHKTPPAMTACIKWRKWYLEFACNLNYSSNE